MIPEQQNPLRIYWLIALWTLAIMAALFLIGCVLIATGEVNGLGFVFGQHGKVLR